MEINRRTFLKGAAGIGVAAAASTFWIVNKSSKSVEELVENAVESDTEILVIGGGIAGVMAAIRAVRLGAKVTLIDKGSIGRSGQTPFANGFRVFDEEAGDDRATWIKDWTTITGGIHHSAYLDNFLDYSKEIYEELVSWGATDVGFGQVLRSKVIEEGVQIIERTMLTNLLEEDGHVVGALGFNLDSEEAVVIKAGAVILCTGAGAFKPSGFQICSLTSDGDAMAYRIGGQISGKEFADTHGTNSETPGYCWGVWQRNWNTGIQKESGGPEVDGGGLTLDLYYLAHAGEIGLTSSASGAPSGEGEMPTDGAPTGEMPTGEMPAGGMPTGETPTGGRTTGGMPTGESAVGEMPAGGRTEANDADSSMGTSYEIGGGSAGLSVHKAEGLFPADDKCGTNIAGLFAAGDCLSSMLAGTQYKGVNGTSLAASGTQGALAGETAAEYVKTVEIPSISDEKIESLKEEMFAPRELGSGYDPAWVTQMLKFNTIPYYVLYIKKEDRLQAALDNVLFFKNHFADKMVASDAHELRLVHETRNMILNAEMKLRASLYRTESRGNHYREDYPDSDDTDWLAWVVIEQDSDGNMKLSKTMVNS
jgi:succinate dehydrogenase/fumarate reductase flavoprotein subunit